MSVKLRWHHDVVQLNNAGLDLLHPIEQVDKDHYSRMDDVKSLQLGTITPRPGTSLINSAALEVAGFVAGTASETEQGCGTVQVTVTSGAGNGVKGAYVTLIASTARISKFWVFTIVQPSGAADARRFTSTDISFDAGSGPEVDFIDGHAFSCSTKTTQPLSTGDTFEFPFEVPAGSRIRARIEDSDALALGYLFTASMIG